MKLSLAWVFDHIKNSSWRQYSIDDIVARFIEKVAEIEGVEKVSYNLDTFSLAQIKAIKNNMVEVESPEWKKEFSLPFRSDAQLNNYYLVKKEKNSYTWATIHDFYGSKDGLVPALWCEQNLVTGAWKKSVEPEDYILHLDNKSITHRPDLWGHRGIAREVAAILDLQLIPEDYILAAKPIKHYEKQAPVSQFNPFALEITDQKACQRFAGLSITLNENHASLPWMALRLMRIDARPINALVDTTNYVMFDLGQPLHAYDAQKVSQKISVGYAHNGDTVTLLDGEKVTLTHEDCVVRDAEKILGLAGIMGAHNTGVEQNTKALFVEAAHFDPIMIRKTAARIKKRTEASARFEKNLDPNQNTNGLLRFLKILTDNSISYKAADSIVSLGTLAQEKSISISHEFISKRLGITITGDTVKRILTAIGFGVQISEKQGQALYTITVPTYRATKDILIKEDIVEEIGRLIGYTSIPYQFPVRAMKPFDTSIIHRIKTIKQQCAFALNMHEVSNYALYDEEFLRTLPYEPTQFIALKNPLSENQKRLVTSLLPHLFKNIIQNKAQHHHLRFFEWGRVWHLSHNKPIESKKLSGVIFDSKKSLDFYDFKALIQPLFNALDILVTWEKPTKQQESWWSSYQTAELVCNGTVIGTAGVINPLLATSFFEGDVYAFEISGDFLQKYHGLIKQFAPLPKYQATELDISMLVPQAVAVAELEMAIAQADARVRDLWLLDFFEKPEWGDKRSVTIRFVVYDDHKTMTKEDIDQVLKHVTEAVQQLGAVVR